jgi:diaminopimelate decarboxylase
MCGRITEASHSLRRLPPHRVLDKEGDGVTVGLGPLGENMDKLAVQRILPKIVNGEALYIPCSGTHGRAMGFNPNGKPRPKELIRGWTVKWN